jgi:hypothetical protein
MHQEINMILNWKVKGKRAIHYKEILPKVPHNTTICLQIINRHYCI